MVASNASISHWKTVSERTCSRDGPSHGPSITLCCTTGPPNTLRWGSLQLSSCLAVSSTFPSTGSAPHCLRALYRMSGPLSPTSRGGWSRNSISQHVLRSLTLRPQIGSGFAGPTEKTNSLHIGLLLSKLLISWAQPPSCSAMAHGGTQAASAKCRHRHIQQASHLKLGRTPQHFSWHLR